MTDRKLEFWRKTPAPGPRLFALATVVCFAGAFITFAIEPWGTTVAGVLMCGWLALASYSVIRDSKLNDALDGTATRAQTGLRRPSQIILRRVLSVAALGLYASFFLTGWLGKPPQAVRDYRDGVLVLAPIFVVAFWLVDPIYDRLTRANLLPPMKPPRGG